MLIIFYIFPLSDHAQNTLFFDFFVEHHASLLLNLLCCNSCNRKIVSCSIKLITAHMITCSASMSENFPGWPDHQTWTWWDDARLIQLAHLHLLLHYINRYQWHGIIYHRMIFTTSMILYIQEYKFVSRSKNFQGFAVYKYGM